MNLFDVMPLFAFQFLLKIMLIFVELMSYILFVRIQNIFHDNA